MKKHVVLSTVILLAGFHAVFGQTEQKKPIQKISIHDFYLQTGIFSERNTYAPLADFKTLAPQSVLLNKDLTDYSSSPRAFSMTGNTMFSAMMGLQFRDKQKTALLTNPLLRLGFSYISGTALTGSLYKEERKTYDTLTSTQTGQTIYMDSVKTETYDMNYNYEQLRIDGSLIFRTDPSARWTIYSGIGVTAGLSINSSTDIYYSSSTRTETRGANGNTTSSFGYSNNRDITREKFNNKNSFGLSTYIPMGIDFRIGKKKEFWKRTHLYYELRPGVNVVSISELRTITNTSLQHGLGLKVSW